MSFTQVFLPFRWRGAALTATILTGCLLLLGIGSGYFGDASDSARQEAHQKAEKLLLTAHSQSGHALNQRLRHVRALFARGRKGADAFAEEALSWSGKWALVKDTLGIGEDDAHAKFLAEIFARYIFTNEDLTAVLEGTVKGYLTDLDGIENQLLIQLRADLADSELGRSGKIPALASDAAFQEEYRQLADGLLNTLELDGKMEIGRQAASMAAMSAATPIVLQIMQFVAAELGIEAGILGAGASSSFATMGVGLVVGIIADQVIAWVLKEAGYDPQAEIAAKVRESLDRVESLLIDGTEKKAGLHRELERIGKTRGQCQDEVINQLLKRGGVQ